MNDVTVQALRVTVERAVCPLAASLKIKRRTREELLAHQIEVFEQELATTGDEVAALARTNDRFGNPEELTIELAASVPKLDRVQRFFEWSDSQPQTFRAAVKRSLLFGAQMILFEMVPIAVAAPFTLTFHDATKVRYGMVTLLLAGGTGAVFVPLLMLCAYCMRRIFFDSPRDESSEVPPETVRARWAKAVGVILGSVILAPAIGVVAFSLISGEAATVLAQAPNLIALGIATPIGAALIGYAEHHEIIRDRVWNDISLIE